MCIVCVYYIVVRVCIIIVMYVIYLVMHNKQDKYHNPPAHTCRGLIIVAFYHAMATSVHFLKCPNALWILCQYFYKYMPIYTMHTYTGIIMYATTSAFRKTHMQVISSSLPLTHNALHSYMQSTCMLGRA